MIRLLHRELLKSHIHTNDDIHTPRKKILSFDAGQEDVTYPLVRERQISSCERVDEGKPSFRRMASAADAKILGRTACVGTTAPSNKFTECEDEFSRTKCTRTLTYFGCGPGPIYSLVLLLENPRRNSLSCLNCLRSVPRGQPSGRRC